MSATPGITTRAEQPYAAVRARVTMSELGGMGAGLGEVFGWLAARGVPPAGAPFFRYNVIDMERTLEVEAGVPVASAVDGDDQVLAAVLPASRYATVTHVGHPDELADVTEGAARLGRPAGPPVGHVPGRGRRGVGLPAGVLPHRSQRGTVT